MGRQERTKEKTSGANWLWAAGICGGLGIFEATQTVLAMRSAGMHHQWAALFVDVLLSWLPWAVAAPSVLGLVRDYPLFRGSSLGAWARHAGACLTIGVGAALWDAGIQTWLNPYLPDISSPGFWALWKGKFLNQLVATVVLYGVILMVGWMLESRERLARQQMDAFRLNEQLAKAQLSALRQQIEPHFLFNTLNTVAGLVREGKNDRAVDMIAGLSDLLRRTLQTSDRQQVALGEELDIVETYLEIEKARFAERLQVKMEVPEELKSARVPSLVLQPIVENAVKHGIAKSAQGGEIDIRAARVNGTLTVIVSNDGPGFPEDWESKAAGIGLRNVRERLASLYGKEARVNIVEAEGGAVVSISVPYRRSGE